MLGSRKMSRSSYIPRIHIRSVLYFIIIVVYDVRFCVTELYSVLYFTPFQPTYSPNPHLQQRIDVLQSSRHIRITLNDIELASTHRPKLLFETSLPVRTYIPKTDCNLSLFSPSKTTTQCPYKGIANYYNVTLPDGSRFDDIVWWYRTPLAEVVDVKGLVAFYDEKVDVWVDGVLQEKPKPRA